MKKLTILLSLSLLFAVSCNRVKDKTKDVINKSGEVVGKGATEFIEGVVEGVDMTLDCELQLSEDLVDKGLKTGTFAIESNTSGGTNNLLTLYIIFDKDFHSDLTVKAFNKRGLEIGRSRLSIQGKAGDAGYFDFTFDKRTHIETKSRLTIE